MNQKGVGKQVYGGFGWSKWKENDVIIIAKKKTKEIEIKTSPFPTKMTSKTTEFLVIAVKSTKLVYIHNITHYQKCHLHFYIWYLRSSHG